MNQQKHSQDSGAQIPMGDCSDCGKPWSMFESEKEWWDSQIKNHSFTMTTRCKGCRKKNKEQKNEKFKQSSPEGVANEIRILASKVLTGNEQEDPLESLTTQLLKLADEVMKFRPAYSDKGKGFVKKDRSRHDESEAAAN